MGNVAADRFCTSLFASVGGRVNADTKLLYRAKLGKKYLTDEQWARTLSLITHNQTSTDRGDVILPPLGDIEMYIRQVQAQDRPAAGLHWLTFWHNGYHRAMRVRDPANPPKPPWDATEVHLVVDTQLEYHEPIREVVPEVEALVNGIARQFEFNREPGSEG